LIRDSEDANYAMSISFNGLVYFDGEETLADDGDV
jgi:hypothetical protein